MSGQISLVPVLLEIQRRHGYLPEAELVALAARRPDWPIHRLHEVASFSPHFRLEPSSALEIRVCRDMACHLGGSPDLKRRLEEIASELAPGRVRVEGVSCLGQCDAPPAVQIGEHVFRGLSETRCRSLVDEALASPSGTFHAPGRDDAGVATGWRIDPYGGREDYGAVRRYIADRDPEAVLEALKVGDLRGMGGAGVWAHQKWSDVRRSRGETKYVVCNADESEPTTFKDREILFRTPHLVLEGVILGGLLVGAERGFIYIRHEYEEQIEAMRAAIARAEAIGVCGQNLLGSGRSFPVEVFVSPGGYICGEQSALIEAMEGKRAEPRNKPPLLETNGLFDKPTLLSNVETFAWTPSIVVRGGEWYRDLGVRGYKGARFFSICGDVGRPGVYEVPCGVTLRELIDEYAGGMRRGERLKAFAPSGPSGGFLPARLPRSALARGFEKRAPERFLTERLPAHASHLDILELELDLQLFRDLGLMLGAGMMVFSERADMLDQALNASEFFRNESCGKCVPCRIGSRKTVELAREFRDRSLAPGELAALEALITEIRGAMEATSICGLGMVAGNPIASVLQHFRDEIGADTSPESPR
jgi:formate dehydrogenase beta subunit